jgi:hypothetical protein
VVIDKEKSLLITVDDIEDVDDEAVDDEAVDDETVDELDPAARLV